MKKNDKEFNNLTKTNLFLEIENLKIKLKEQNEKMKIFLEERKEMKKDLKKFSKRIENLKNENNNLKKKLGIKENMNFLNSIENNSSLILKNEKSSKTLKIISEKDTYRSSENKFYSQNKKKSLRKRLSRKINLNLKLKNLSYKDYIEKFVKEENKTKIKKLMKICYFKEKQNKRVSSVDLNYRGKKLELNKRKNEIFSNNVLERKSKISEENLSEKNDFSKIYNNFFILSCDFKKLDTFVKNEKIDFEIVFSGNQKQKDILRKDKDLIKFFVPFKKKIEKLEFLNDLSKVNDLLFKEKPFNEKIDFFCISLTSEIKKKFLIKNYEFLINSNPELFKYYYILKFQDFIIQDKNDESQNIVLNYHPKFYIFETFYPLSIFFKKILYQFLYSIKKQKIKIFMDFQKSKKVKNENIQKIDSNKILKIEKQFYKKIQNFLKTQKMSSNFETQITLNLFNQKTLYNFPSKKQAPYSQSKFGYSYVFNYLKFQEFLFLYLSIIFENNIVFISKSSFKISAFLTTFLNLLKPFKWTFPSIFNLPEDLLMMIGSPLPMLIGLNNSSDYVINEIIPNCGDTSGNTIFVFLDFGVIYFNPNLLEKLVIPEFDGFFDKIKKFYRENFNKKDSGFLKIAKKKKNKKVYHLFKTRNYDQLKEKLFKISKGIKFKEDKNSKLYVSFFEQKKNQEHIFFFFKYFFNSFIISKLSYNKQEFYLQKEFNSDNVDINFFSDHPSDIKFLKAFFKTQSFVYFLENYVFE